MLIKAFPPPPPPSDFPIPSKRSRKKLYAIIAIAVIAVAIVVPVLLLFTGGNAAANASTLTYKQTIAYEGGQDTWTVYVKNFNTPTPISRSEGTSGGEQIIAIEDDTTGQYWICYQGQWQDSSSMYNATLSRQSWDVLKAELRSWNGVGTIQFSFMDNNVTISDIQVNPTLPDSLFQH
jgi:hypothetical protein